MILLRQLIKLLKKVIIMGSTFDYVKSINSGQKIDLGTDYNQFIINYALSLFPDCILKVNEVNIAGLTDEMHYKYLMSTIRPRKRFKKWPKKTRSYEDILLIANLYKYNVQRAREALSALTDEELAAIKKRTTFEA